jgi:hypothetical protein
MGFDFNLRKSIAMSSGDYAIILGNDDSLHGEHAIQHLVDFLREHSCPDVGFCNMIEERTGNQMIKRAFGSKVIGSGSDVALQYYSCFSFVGGLIFKKSSFSVYNTDAQDGSVFAQIYLAVKMIADGKTLFCIEEPLVIKDLLIDGNFRNSYRDRIAKKWKNFKIVDGGMHSVINVLFAALRDVNKITSEKSFYIFRRIYGITFPHWIMDYRSNKALPEAVGLFMGMFPGKNKNLTYLSWYNKLSLYLIYYISGIIAMLFPVYFFNKWKMKAYAFLKNIK